MKHSKTVQLDPEMLDAILKKVTISTPQYSSLLSFQVFFHTEHGTLKSLLHNETVQLDPEMLTAILKDVTMGLKYLHGHDPPLIEQDLIPLSVLLTGDYVAQLAHHDALMQAVGPFKCFDVLHDASLPYSTALSVAQHTFITACLKVWTTLTMNVHEKTKLVVAFCNLDIE